MQQKSFEKFLTYTNFFLIPNEPLFDGRRPNLIQFVELITIAKTLSFIVVVSND